MTKLRISRSLLVLVLVLALSCSGMARAQVDLSGLDDGMAGPRAQVLVLGSVHLSGMPRGFRPESLEPLLDRLAAFKPDIITIEDISGEQCDMMARHPAVYEPAALSPYCRDPEAARSATGLDVPSATAEVRRTLRDWPAAPTPSQRRRLAALFLAANEQASALVQWFQLPQAERRAGDGLDDALVALLDRAATRNNESYQIGARLAARLGLQRVFAIDDHTGDNVDVPDTDAYGLAIQRAWEAASAPALPTRKRQSELAAAGDMLALFRYVNSPEVLRVVVDSDFGAALKDDSPQHYGQYYVAGWEVRNLRMAANVRASFRERPGARVLSIVGVSHKPWFDSLLDQMQGVEVVDAGQVLGR